MTDPPIIGVLAPVPGGLQAGGLLSGITRELNVTGGHLLVLQTLDAGANGEVDRQSPRLLAPTGWDHLRSVVVLGSAADRRHLDSLRRAGKSVVLASSSQHGFPAPVAMPDNIGGVRSAVEHLLGHGHVRIAFAGSLVHADTRERLDAYKGALTDHGIPVDLDLFLRAPDNLESGGRQVAEQVHRATGGVTAVVA